MLLNKQQHGFLITFIVILLGVVGMFATDIYVPSMPLITHALHTNSNLMKITITIYLLGFSISPLLFGHISDRFGRKSILMIFATIALVGTLIAATSMNIEQLIIGRLIQGIGFGIVTALSRTIFVDLFEGVKLAQMASLISFFISLAPAIAPVLGSYIQVSFGWRAVFIFLNIYLLIMVMLVFWKVPETIQQKNLHATKIKNILKSYNVLLCDKKFLGYVINSSMAFAGGITFFSLSPFIFQIEYHLSVIAYGWVITCITFMSLLSRLVNIFLVRYITTDQTILIGQVMMSSSSIILILLALSELHSLSLIVITMMFFILGTGFIYSNATANALSPFRHMGGIAGALFGSLQTFGAFFAGFIVSQLPNSIMSLAATLLCVSLVSLFAFLKCCGVSKRLVAATSE